MLQLGGLENTPPTTNQSANRFKVAKNVSFNKSFQITPRPPLQAFTENTNVSLWTHITNYSLDSEMLKFGIDTDSSMLRKAYKNSTLVPSYRSLGVDSVDATFKRNFSDQSFEFNRVKYVLMGAGTTYSTLYKYDGKEISSAGIGVPYFFPRPNKFNVGEVAYSTTGSKYIKVVSHAMDFQGNQITSDTVSYATDGKSQRFDGMAFGNGVFVGVGDSNISYSYDGVLWDSNVRYNQNSDVIWRSVTYSQIAGSPYFVAVGTIGGGAGTSTIAISHNGLDWRFMNAIFDGVFASFNYNLKSVAWSSTLNLFCVAGSDGFSGQSIVATSPDAKAWTIVYSSTTDWAEVGVNSTGFVVLNSAGTTTNGAITSTNGTVWTLRTILAGVWESLTFGNGVWVAVASSGTNRIMTNTDPFSATAWVARTAPVGSDWRSVVYGEQTISSTKRAFIAVSLSGLAMYSLDGITWVALTTPVINYGASAYGIVSTKGVFTFGGISKVSYTGFADTVTVPSTITETTCPVTIKLDLSSDITLVNNFLFATKNASYYEEENGKNDPYFYGKATYASGTNQFNLTTLDVPTDFWGINGLGTAGNIYVIRLINFNYTPSIGAAAKRYSAIAYKVKPGGTSFYGDFLAYNSDTLIWDTLNGNNVPEASGIFSAGRRFFTVWAASSENGIYYFKGVATGACDKLNIYSSAVIYYFDVASTVLENRVYRVSNLPFSIAPALNDWYDIYSAKYSFNEISLSEKMVALTSYQSSLIIATEDLIYFSDATSGGSFEMTAGTSSVKIGDSEHGNITSVVGTKDFLIVSRERKVYMVAGALDTAQYRVQEIPGISIGAYSNSSMLEIDGNVYMLTSTGIWWINAANAKLISDNISLNFKTYLKNYNVLQPQEESDCVIFDMKDFPTNAWDTTAEAKFIISAYDSYRGLIVFSNNSSDLCGSSLVFHLNNQEWTNWNSYDGDSYFISAMTFFNGVLYVASYNDTYNKARFAEEETDPNVFQYDYFSRSSPRLVTTWITAGEPSLEKQVLQLKIFGRMLSDLNIKHYNNWDITTPITNTTYKHTNDYLFYHKQRLNSSKALAYSVEISSTANGESFWIEGLEVELDIIQAGMKK